VKIAVLRKYLAELTLIRAAAHAHDKRDRKRPRLSPPDASPLALKGSACAPPIKANGADCDSQFRRKQGEFYGTFQSQIVKTAQEQKVRKSTSDDIHEYIHKFFRDLAEDLEKSNDLVVNLEQELTLGDKYHIFVAVKRFKPIKTLPIDTTCDPWQYVILSKDGNFIGIEEYPAIKAIEKTWYKQIPMNIYILSKNGKEISRHERDETRKQVEEYFFSNEQKSKFSFKEFVKSI